MPRTPSTPGRRPTPADALILALATALAVPGWWWVWRWYPGPGKDLADAIALGLAGWPTREAGFLLMCCSVPVAAAWTVALIPLRLRRPRPPRRRLAGQPGLAATVGAGGSLAISGLWIAAVRAAGGEAIFEDNDVALWQVVAAPGLAGAAVLGSWIALILGRRWRAEASWIDRLGRLLGCYWIALAIAAPVVAGWVFY